MLTENIQKIAILSFREELQCWTSSSLFTIVSIFRPDKSINYQPPEERYGGGGYSRFFNVKPYIENQGKNQPIEPIEIQLYDTEDAIKTSTVALNNGCVSVFLFSPGLRNYALGTKEGKIWLGTLKNKFPEGVYTWITKNLSPVKGLYDEEFANKYRYLETRWLVDELAKRHEAVLLSYCGTTKVRVKFYKM